MLTQIDLRHFKCFRILRLPLSPLTLLSGANASGKSTVLQALVLLHQTMCEQEWSSRLLLNGGTIRLGTVVDVIDQIHGRGSCEIALMDDFTEFRWEFAGQRHDMSMAVVRVYVEGFDDFEIDDNEPLHYLLPHRLPSPSVVVSLTERLRKLTYLTAERIGPREIYALEDIILAPTVGPQGQNAPSILHSGGEMHVLDRLAIKGVPPTRLRQAEARMDRLFPGCEFTVQKVPNANTLTMGLRTSKGLSFQSPIHTGFGLTQVLPIVVAALSADRDDLLLIENPEVHLHPSGQAAMGEFLAEVAAAGVQVILETHSDHVLNGIRRAVKKRMLLSNDVSLHFFRPRAEDEQGDVLQVDSPALDQDGNVDAWPEGFFDQFDRDMNYFAGWG